MATKDMVTWAYRLFLDREPENEEATNAYEGVQSSEELRRVFLKSEEYYSRNKIYVRTTESIERLEVESKVSESDSRRLCDHIARVWMALGYTCPHWSVLSADEFKPENILQYEESFFGSGIQDVDALRATLARNGIDPQQLHHVVEYGCGLGRVTRFLAEGFAEVSAIDISRSHLQKARDYLSRKNLHNVDLKLANFFDFGLPSAYDLWFSRIVLQHNPPPIIRLVLEQALKRLSPGGVAVFQVPTYAQGYRFSIKDYLADIEKNQDRIEMHCLPMEDILDIACEGGCVPMEVMNDSSVTDPGWVSTQFVIRKPRSNGGS